MRISIESLDSTVIFHYNTVVKFSCVEGEPNLYGYDLFENNNRVGLIGLQLVSLYLDIFIEPCLNSSSFEGALVR